MRRLFIMRKDLNMSAGKLAAQVAHCAEAYWTRLLRDGMYEVLKMDIRPWYSKEFLFGKDNNDIIGYSSDSIIDKDVFEQYVCGTFTKTICEAKNKNHLLKAKVIAEEMGLVENIDFGMIYDNCLTELEPEEDNGTTLTGVWFKPLPDEVSKKISKKFQLYK